MGYSSKVRHLCKVCRLLDLHPELKEVIDKKLQRTASIRQVINKFNELGYKIARETLRQHYLCCLSLEDTIKGGVKMRLNAIELWIESMKERTSIRDKIKKLFGFRVKRRVKDR